MNRETMTVGAGSLAAGAAAGLGATLALGASPAAAAGSAAVVALACAAASAPLMIRSTRAMRTLAARIGEAAQGDEAAAATLHLPGVPDELSRAVVDAIETMRTKAEASRASARQTELRLRIVEAERDSAVAVLNSLQDAVVVTDAFNELKLANGRAAELLGFDPGASEHKPIGDLIEDDRLRGMISEALDVDSPAHRKHVEYAPSANGDGAPPESYYDVTLACLPDQKEGVGGVVTILRDVTREREISQMKSDFVSKASHELRTPLSSINAYLELLLDGEATDEENRQEFYQIIKNEADRLGRLIDNMLNISRIEAGIMRISVADVDFVEIGKSAVEVIQPQARLKEISVSLQYGPLAYTATADRDMIHQVFLNLLSNAVKYTPEGGRVTVAIENDDATSSVMVTVADTGLGIPPDDLEKVFDKFYRIDNYKRVAKGTGLGLNLVKQIVETVHHGHVRVESTLGMGSKFIFFIPYQHEGA